MSHHLEFRFEDNGTAHGDLVFVFGDYEHRGDSYYLRLDPGVDASDETNAKVRKVLSRIVQQWQVYVENALVGDTIYLPFEFSDQSTHWLQCCMADSKVTLVPGWSTIEGWSFAPTDFGRHVNEVDTFTPLEDVAQLEMDKTILEMHLAAMLERIGIDPEPPQLA